jgi:hypothetical protein
MLGAETDIQQANNDNRVDIYHTRSRSANRLRIGLDDVRAMEAALASIAKNADGMLNPNS